MRTSVCGWHRAQSDVSILDCFTGEAKPGLDRMVGPEPRAHATEVVLFQLTEPYQEYHPQGRSKYNRAMFALILAGGKGERLRPLTDQLPKPMVPVCGKPVLEHQISWLQSEGIVTDVMFLAGYRWQTIQNHFGDGQRFGIRVHYSVEDSPLGRGGAVKKGLGAMTSTDGPVVVLNGDTITEEPLSGLLEKHQERTSINPAHLATIMVVPFVSPYGLVDLGPQDNVIGFKEKVALPHWINAGIYVFEQTIARDLPDVGEHEDLTFPKLAQRKQILAVKSTKFWIGIDSFKDLREAEGFLS